MSKGGQVCYFDSDIYFQKSVKDIFDNIASGKLSIVDEGLNIGENKIYEKVDS